MGAAGCINNLNGIENLLLHVAEPF